MSVSFHLLAEYAGAWMLFALAWRNAVRAVEGFEDGDGVGAARAARIVAAMVLGFALASHAMAFTSVCP